jgi:RNA polymerase sigma factor (sigma-70 family)
VAKSSLQLLIHQLMHRLVPESESVSDVQLLERFIKRQDEAAFEALVWRHGPMVLGVCRRILHDDHAAEDAFQMTFLVLFRKAKCIRRRQSLPHWLFKVAYRIALESRDVWDIGLVQQEIVDTPDGRRPAAHPDLSAVLDDALNRLPRKYRTVLVLHYLQGKTVEQLAREVGTPTGTVSSRLNRAKQMLRQRLLTHGPPVPWADWWPISLGPGEIAG